MVRLNKKGTTAFVNVMIAFTIIIIGVVMIDPLKEQHEQADTALDCDNNSISTGNRMTCVGNDAAFPIFILVVFGVAIAYAGAKKVGIGGGGGE